MFSTSSFRNGVADLVLALGTWVLSKLPERGLSWIILSKPFWYNSYWRWRSGREEMLQAVFRNRKTVSFELIVNTTIKSGRANCITYPDYGLIHELGKHMDENSEKEVRDLLSTLMTTDDATAFGEIDLPSLVGWDGATRKDVIESSLEALATARFTSPIY